MATNAHPEPAVSRENPLWLDASLSSSAKADGVLEFGRFHVLLRRRQLLADGLPVELGTRTFDLLLVLLEADGSLVTKEELLSRVWQGIVVSEENLKVQVSTLRKVLGADRDIIRTECGRGYRFVGALRWNPALDTYQCRTRAELRSGRALFPRNHRQSLRCSFSSN